MEKRNTNWIPTDNRFVAFFDILGFKDRIMRSSHQDIYKDLENLHSEFDLIQTQNVLDEFDTGVHFVNFSDSFAIFSKSNSIEDFSAFCYITAHSFIKILELNIPVKGAVAYGLCSVNKENRIFFGQPIIDAFQLEEDLNYLGIVCHHTFTKYLEDFNGDKTKLVSLNKMLKEHKTPLKSGIITHTNIAWYETPGNDDIKKHLELLNNFRFTMSGSARKYLDNTIGIINKTL